MYHQRMAAEAVKERNDWIRQRRAAGLSPLEILRQLNGISATRGWREVCLERIRQICRGNANAQTLAVDETSFAALNHNQSEANASEGLNAYYSPPFAHHDITDVNQRLASIDQRLLRVYNRLINADQRLINANRRLSEVKQRLADANQRLAGFID